MINTAVVVPEKAGGDGVSLYDTVTVFLPEDKSEKVFQIVSTVRQDALHGRISLESPVGRALLGKKVGDTVHIQVKPQWGYDMVIRSIEKGEDDGSAPLNQY